MSTCKHKNVLNYYSSFTTGKELWIILPLFEAGSIETLHHIDPVLFKDGCKDEVMIASILKQVVEGLTTFHEAGLIHRDIKGQNVLMAKDGRVVIGDFGMADSAKVGSKKAFVGSPAWMAPEVME